ncbi:unnamed protein product [Gordionus sp. m RMFG-2023]
MPTTSNSELSISSNVTVINYSHINFKKLIKRLSSRVPLNNSEIDLRLNNSISNWLQKWYGDLNSTIQKLSHSTSLSNPESFDRASQMIKNLLKSYDVRLRPDFGGSPVYVGISMRISNFNSMSEVNMDYTITVLLYQYWKDERLNWGGLNYQKFAIPGSFSDSIWVPDTFIANDKYSYIHDVTEKNKMTWLYGDGSIAYGIRFTTTLACMMNLKNYPLDEQNCTVEIESYGYTTSDVIMYWKEKNAVKGLDEMELPQFNLLEYRIVTTLETLPTGVYQRLSLSFRLQRNIGYFIFQTYLPCLLIVMLSWVSFWINHEATSARIALGITTVLTMTTISSGVRLTLPRISYVKALDIYLVICFMFVFAALLEYAAVNYTYWGSKVKRRSRKPVILPCQNHMKFFRNFVVGKKDRRDDSKTENNQIVKKLDLPENDIDIKDNHFHLPIKPKIPQKFYDNNVFKNLRFRSRGATNNSNDMSIPSVSLASYAFSPIQKSYNKKDNDSKNYQLAENLSFLSQTDYDKEGTIDFVASPGDYNKNSDESDANNLLKPQKSIKSSLVKRAKYVKNSAIKSTELVADDNMLYMLRLKPIPMIVRGTNNFYMSSSSARPDISLNNNAIDSTMIDMSSASDINKHENSYYDLNVAGNSEMFKPCHEYSKSCSEFFPLSNLGQTKIIKDKNKNFSKSKSNANMRKDYSKILNRKGKTIVVNFKNQARRLKHLIPLIKNVNIIDKYSRVIFPFIFFLFNIFYWFYYLCLSRGKYLCIKFR